MQFCFAIARRPSGKGYATENRKGKGRQKTEKGKGDGKRKRDSATENGKGIGRRKMENKMGNGNIMTKMELNKTNFC